MTLRPLVLVIFIFMSSRPQAHAMESEPEKVNVREHFEDGNYSLTFERINLLFESYSEDIHTRYSSNKFGSVLIEAIIENNTGDIQDFLLKNSRSLDTGDCIIALYHAYKHQRPHIESLLAKNQDIAVKLMLDHQIGIALLLILSIEHDIAFAFRAIIDYDKEILQYVPSRFFDRALYLAHSTGKEHVAMSLLEHDYIATKITKNLLHQIRFTSGDTSYFALVKKIIASRNSW